MIQYNRSDFTIAKYRNMVFTESEKNMKTQPHNFIGKWITTDEFFDLSPRNVFHRQAEPLELAPDEHQNRHVLFRKKFVCQSAKKATVYISADDYYKLYINGTFVAQGPTAAYHFRYNFNEIDVSAYLRDGENTIAVHTLYQGLINRVWQSGDYRHGLILDLVCDGKTIVSSDESFKTVLHSGYKATGIFGYQTQFAERYDSRAREVGFEKEDFDDSYWQNARVNLRDDHRLVPQQSDRLVFETIHPKAVRKTVENSQTQTLFYDFGATYVGCLAVRTYGKSGDVVTVRCGQELNDDGSVRYDLRANCKYEEEWILSDGESVLSQYDYKSFRYVELCLPETATVKEVKLEARHYPFVLHGKLRDEFRGNADLEAIWKLCVDTQKYGVQEVIQDCMEREKGFYLGDGCYTALTHMLLTGDDAMVRRLIDDAFATTFISDTLVTCMNCSFMQEIAEYPLILVYLVLWHYRYTDDKAYLARNYPKVTALLDAYRNRYEKNGLLRDLDKWCVVEWPKNFQHGYDVDVTEGKVCTQAHVSIHAYYLAAVRTANTMADCLTLPPYRDTEPLEKAFFDTFYDEKRRLFKDGENTEHVSLVGNSFVYAFGLCNREEFETAFYELYDRNGISSLSMFCTFPVLMGFVRHGRTDRVKEALLDENAWKRILREGGTTTFEGWGKDTKWNTSLFHLTMSYAATFMVDTDSAKLFS